MKKLLIILTMLVSSFAYSHYSPIITELDANMFSKTKNGTIKATPEDIQYFCNISADLNRNISYNLLAEANEMHMNSQGAKMPQAILLDIKNTFEYKMLKMNSDQYSGLKIGLTEELTRTIKETQVQPRDLLREIPTVYAEHCLKNPKELIVNYDKIFK